ncbi:hypothetical protein [Streptomyces sp. Je 1-332]|uniref:hypothetical protein n=1 Tax=Streptomyces sp. Je 1-332 TaxID=3231270 RepID=UPI0034592526
MAGTFAPRANTVIGSDVSVQVLCRAGLPPAQAGWVTVALFTYRDLASDGSQRRRRRRPQGRRRRSRARVGRRAPRPGLPALSHASGPPPFRCQVFSTWYPPGGKGPRPRCAAALERAGHNRVCY